LLKKEVGSFGEHYSLACSRSQKAMQFITYDIVFPRAATSIFRFGVPTSHTGAVQRQHQMNHGHATTLLERKIDQPVIKRRKYRKERKTHIRRRRQLNRPSQTKTSLPNQTRINTLQTTNTCLMALPLFSLTEAG
jgi:hypothetical protein